jgi:hypothetical protein
MKRIVVFLVAVLTAATMLGAFPAIVGADNAVPFKGSVEYTLTGAEDGAFVYVGTGNVTHMGLVTATADVVPIVFGVKYSTTVVLIAANGDQLFLSGQGKITSSPGTGVETITIMGGTGRFTHATGELVSTDVFSADLSNGTVTFEGTIQY